ncbi:hypothetical protein Shewana3_2955 [Shewanella sp. ANA-3]|uniref:helix-turn-helix domain-containing protein n=1 Tax=Shewanella sp. (strain ANA-3) TaxID=94122 RepID=UPI00005DCD10|nr:helix-turn-helix domain-containing protein [Shewanella sp. ANA-3]ABK49181.1 hypothetical protein Shewana3_2955 [Shewanella sp. ANA-3]
MSNKILTVLRDYRLPEGVKQRTATKCVLFALADRANDKSFKCFPGLTTLANDAEMSIRGVQRCIKQLAVLGIISIKRRTATSNVYTINLDTLIAAIDAQLLDKEIKHTQKCINIWNNLLLYPAEKGVNLSKYPSSEDSDAIDFALKIEPNLIDKKMLALFCDFIIDEFGDSAAPFNPFIRLKLTAEQLHNAEATLTHHWKSYLNIFGD